MKCCYLGCDLNSSGKMMRLIRTGDNITLVDMPLCDYHYRFITAYGSQQYQMMSMA